MEGLTFTYVVERLVSLVAYLVVGFAAAACCGGVPDVLSTSPFSILNGQLPCSTQQNVKQVTGSGVLLAQSRRRHRSDRRLLVGLPGARHRRPAAWACANLRRH